MPVSTSRPRSILSPSTPKRQPKALTITSHRYPKHVWSPAGGWYTQPANWKANVAVIGAVVLGMAALTWNSSAHREHRDHMPRPGRFYPSRKFVGHLEMNPYAGMQANHLTAGRNKYKSTKGRRRRRRRKQSHSIGRAYGCNQDSRQAYIHILEYTLVRQAKSIHLQSLFWAQRCVPESFQSETEQGGCVSIANQL